MAMFVVLMESPNDELLSEIKARFPSDHFAITPSQILISADSTVDALSDLLDIRKGRFGKTAILRIDGRGQGWHSKALWDWLNQKLTSNG
jgi:hypothetical protein